METRNIFQNLSCLDHRYSLSEKEVFGKLSQYISEEAAVRSYAKAEAALIKAHLSVRGQLTSEIEKKLDEVARKRSDDKSLKGKWLVKNSLKHTVILY